MDGLAGRTVKNSLFGVLEFVWPIVLSIVITPFIVHKLGTDAYGIFSIIIVMVGFFGLMDLGLGISAVRDVAEHYERGDYKEIGRVLNSLLLVYLIIGVAGLLIIAGSTGFLVERILNIPAAYLEVAKFSFYVASIGFLLNMISGVFSSIPRAAQRFDISTKISIFLATVTSLSSFLILFFDLGLRGIVISNLIISVVALVIYVFVAIRIIPELEFNFRLHKDIFFRLFKFSGFFFITAISGVVLLQLDKLLIGSLLSMSFVTYYVIPSGLAQKIQGLITSAMNILLPLSSALSGTGQINRLREIYKSTLRVVLSVATMVSIPLIIFSYKFLFYWISPEFASQSSSVLMLLIPTYFLLGVTTVPWVICLGIGRSKINAFFSVMVAALNVILIFAFYKPLGLNGFALAYLVSVLFTNPLAIYYIEKKILGLSGIDFWKIYYKIFLLGIIQGVLAYFISLLANNLVTTVLLIGLSIIIYPILFFIFKMATEEEKQLIYKLFKKDKNATSI